MIIFGAFFVNILVTVIFYLRNPKEYKWYEFLIGIVITTALIFGVKALVDYSSVSSTEYWGETIQSVYEEEPYNYWQHKTCTESYACGTDSDGNTKYCTRTYDCSYQEDIGPQWYCLTENGNTYKMSEKYHDELVSLFGTRKTKIQTRKNYDYSDPCYYSNGTKFSGKRVGRESYVYRTDWNHVEETRKGVFTEHRYENKIKASDLSLFNISVIKEEEADSLGLYQYPDINKYKCPVIIGVDVSEETQDKFRRLNAKFGPTNQLRLWILVYKNKTINTAILQENYWVKGNKNELVVCIGINDSNEVMWSHSFSWALSATLTAEVKSKVLEMYEYTVETNNTKLPIAVPIKMISDVTGLDSKTLPSVLPLGDIAKSDVKKVTKSASPVFNERTLEEYYNYLDANLSRFERRQFEEFSYVKVDPKWWHILLVYLFTAMASVGLNLYFSNNELNDKENNYRNYSRRRFRR